MNMSRLYLCCGHTVLALLLTLLSGCASTAHYNINQPLKEAREQNGYRLQNLAADDNTDDIILTLAFSGGGYRASTLAYGVLEELRQIEITRGSEKRRLLDEIDFISSVSGGSLTAAYYGLYREKIFTHFEPEVLQADLQSSISGRILSPRGLFRINSLRYGRADIVEEVLNEKVFAGKTFSDLPFQRPLLIINATEMIRGERFEFTQSEFDRLCSNLNPFPIARAVAASMALPVVFSPVTLWNYSDECPAIPSRLSMRPSGRLPDYLHLLDGGLSDNIGVRGPLDMVNHQGGLVRAARAAGLRHIKHIAFIIVNAEATPEFSEDFSANTPSLLRTFRAFIDIPINRYSGESLRLLRDNLNIWRSELRRSLPEETQGVIDPNAQFYLIEINFDQIKNENLRNTLRNIPTTLRLESADIHLLKQTAAQLLRDSPEFNRLLNAVAP
jgi:NTE family protein